MKCQSHFVNWLLPVLVAGVLVAIARISENAADRARQNNNPDQFNLFSTTNSFEYFFTYDPLAADEWLFHAGGNE